ncbi:MAG: VWA domain-containing protein [Ilumatobacteraceae bacterium]
MTLLRPSFLWLLLIVAGLVGGYVFMQRRRRHYAVRFTNMDLLASVAPKRPGWRRHLPAGVVALAMIVSVIGLARPAHDVQVTKKTAVVMLVVDVSASMAATDVAPTRLKAAISAGSDFVASLPSGFEVGLVSFSNSANVLVNPTKDHASVVAAIKALQLGKGTAAGDAIEVALGAIETAKAAASSDLVASAVRPAATGDAKALTATIVLLSDGGTTVGEDPADAAAAAAAANVPVSTITYGTDSGTVVIQGETVPVPPDSRAMQQIADVSGGKAFDATNTSELNSVYDSISGEVGHATEQRQLIVWFLAIALILMTIACIGSLLWTGRFL